MNEIIVIMNVTDWNQKGKLLMVWNYQPEKFALNNIIQMNAEVCFAISTWR